MPNYDELLDAALLATSDRREAQRAAIDALREAYPEEPGGLALDVLATLWRGDLEAARTLAEGMGERPCEKAVRAEMDGYEGDREGAGRALEAALAAAPDDPIVLRCAHSIFGVDDPHRSLAIARRRVELRPHDPMGYSALGTSLLATSVEEAERLAADPPPAFADTAGLHNLRANLARKRHDLPAAEAACRAAVAANSDSYMAWAILADVVRHLGRKEEAERAARFSLELNRRNPMALRCLASLASARGDRAEAARLEGEARAAIPALAFMGAMRKANALAREGKPREALAALDGIVTSTGHARNAARTIRATILLGMEDDAALRAEAEAMDREGTEDAMPVRVLAELDRRAGRVAEARARLEEGFARWPDPLAGDLVRARAESGGLDAARALALWVPGLPADAASVYLALDRAGLKAEAASFLDLAQRRYPEAQTLGLLRAGALAGAGNIPGMLHAMRGLDAEHRPRIRLKIPLGRLLRLLWRRSRNRRGPRGGVE